MSRPWLFFLMWAVPAATATWTQASEPPAKAVQYPLWDGKETVAEYAKRAGLEPTVTLKLNDKVSLELVLIPAGKFIMGSPETEQNREPSEGPQHEVTISRPFYMGQYEVAQEQYEAVMEKNPSHFKGARLPVEQVSWNEAQEFCKRAAQRNPICVGRVQKVTEAETAQIRAMIGRLGDADFHVRQKAQTELVRLGDVTYPFLKELLDNPEGDREAKAGASAVLGAICSRGRLPTEAEWEYACRAGTKTRFYAGDADEDLKAAGWSKANSENQTHPVGGKQPNAWGLYDMHGNVWECCQDLSSEPTGMGEPAARYEAGAAVDPKGPEAGDCRVVRGGSWYDDPRFCRSAHRYRNGPDLRDPIYGFRLVMDLK